MFIGNHESQCSCLSINRMNKHCHKLLRLQSGIWEKQFVCSASSECYLPVYKSKQAGLPLSILWPHAVHVILHFGYSLLAFLLFKYFDSVTNSLSFIANFKQILFVLFVQCQHIRKRLLLMHFRVFDSHHLFSFFFVDLTNTALLK